MNVYIVRYVTYGGEHGILYVQSRRDNAETAIRNADLTHPDLKIAYAFIDERPVETSVIHPKYHFSD